MLIKRNPLFLKHVSLQFANETHIVDVFLQFFISFLQFSKGIQHDSEQNVHQNDHNDDNEHLVIDQPREVFRVVNADIVDVTTT